MAKGRDANNTAQASMRVAAAAALRKLTGLLRRSRSVGAVPDAAALTCATASLGRSGPQVTMCEAEAETLSQQFSRVDSLKLSLPRRFFLAKELVLPGTDHDELDSMVSFELSGLFPVDPDDLAWDWHVLEVTPEGYTRVRVVAAETDGLEERLAPACTLEHTALAAEPATVSLANLLCACSGGWPATPVAVVAAWNGSLDFALVGPGGLEFDRGTPLALSETAGEVAASVAASLAMVAENRQGHGASRVVLWADRDAPQLRDAIAAETGLAVEPGVMPAFMESEEPPSVRQAVAAGAALGALLFDGIRLSLVPPKRRHTEELNSRAGSALLTAVVVILALFFAWAALNLRARRLSHYVARLEARAAEIAPEASQIDAKRQRLAAIERQLTGQNKVLEILVELYRITPPDVSLTSLELDDDGLLTLKGHAQEMYRASEYAQILEKSDIFGEPAQQGPVSFQRTEGGKTFISFTILRDLSEVD